MQPEDKKEVNKVINGKAKTKKKSEVHKFADIFFAEDIDAVKSYIFHDVMIPAVKKMIQETVDIFLYGEKGKRRDNSTRAYSSSRASYEKYYDKDRRDDRDRNDSNRARGGFQFDDILFDTRGDAMAVLEELEELVGKFRVASVMDLYSAAGLSCDYTYNKYGWTDLRNAEVVRTRDGDYVIKLPKAMAIN